MRRFTASAIFFWSLVISHWSFAQSPQSQPAAAPTPAPIRDIAPPIDVFPYPAWQVATVAGAALVILALAAWFLVRWFRNRPAPTPPTPRETAIANLNKAREQIESLDPYSFSILVSDILRAYVAAQFHLHAKEQTSPEFLASISEFTSFTDQEKTLLSVFLEKCDLIKFARIDATSEDSAMLLEQAIRFVKGGAA
jgi:hypothetical protein